MYKYRRIEVTFKKELFPRVSSGSRGGQGGHGPPWPVKIGEQNGRSARRLIFDVSGPPISEISGAGTASVINFVRV